MHNALRYLTPDERAEWDSLEAVHAEAQRFEPDYEPSEETRAADSLFDLIKFYRLFNPEVGEMLSKAYLTLKNRE